MLALFNFNTYLGGGETLFVRMAEYLSSHSLDFILFYHDDSYIEKDLNRVGIDQKHRVSISGDIDYYYLNKAERKAIINKIVSFFPEGKHYDLLSFCARETYMLTDLTKRIKDVKLSHLVLHAQDNLYACQSIIDKGWERLTGVRRFGRKKMIDFNTRLFNELSSKGALIPMSVLGARLWKNSFGIAVSEDYVVPLPTYHFAEEKPTTTFKKKIIWIGRIVNFKIPSLLVVLNFLKSYPEYTLTIIGYGEEEYINNYIHKHGINKEQINFLGKVDYSGIGDVIKQHSIGYAMGTSIIELGKFGIPVIMALSRLDYKKFKTDICGDLFYKAAKGDVGSAYNSNPSEGEFPLLEDVVKYIENNYEETAKKTYEYVKDYYDLDNGISNYLDYIDKLGSGGSLDIDVPYSGLVRRILFKLLRK